MKQARFWLYHRAGWVRVKLRPGHPLTFSYGGPQKRAGAATRKRSPSRTTPPLSPPTAMMALIATDA